jgi:hypothetical protein
MNLQSLEFFLGPQDSPTVKVELAEGEKTSNGDTQDPLYSAFMNEMC